MAGHQKCTSPDRPTSPSGGRVGRALPVGTISAPGDRTARTATAARGLSGAYIIPSPPADRASLLFLHKPLFIFINGYIYMQTKCTEHRRRSLPGSGTRSPRMDTTSAETGLWSALWLAAIGKDITFGGAPKSSGARGFSSLVAKVRLAPLFPLLAAFLVHIWRGHPLTTHPQASTTASRRTGVSPSSPSSVSRFPSTMISFPQMHHGFTLVCKQLIMTRLLYSHDPS